MYVPKPGGGGDFQPVPAGNFPAICYAVIDLGTQDETFQGEHKRMHKIRISFELQDDECMLLDGRPMSIHQEYTWSMSDKAKLRAHLQSWRGKAFTDADFAGPPNGFDIRNILGKPVMVAVTQKTKGDKTYSNLTGLAPVPKKLLPLDKQVNESVYLALDESFEAVVYGQLSEWLRTKIAKSPEYQAIQRGEKPSGDINDEHQGRNYFDKNNDDEIPF